MYTNFIVETLCRAFVLVSRAIAESRTVPKADISSEILRTAQGLSSSGKTPLKHYSCFFRKYTKLIISILTLSCCLFTSRACS